jgi:ferrous iron transport protein A
MIKQIIPLSKLPMEKKGRINDIQGGLEFQRRLCTMGIRKDQEIKILSKQPFRGPITIQISGCMVTIGQGMAQKIKVEVM